MALTPGDVERLTRTPSAKIRADVAGKIAQGYSNGTLSGREKDIAIEIFRLLVKDAEVKVRAALSHHLKSCMDIPREVVLKLAHDVENVSVPMLEFSRLLTDDDLLAVVESSAEIAKLEAVARREYVGEDVSGALLGTRHVRVATTLFGNRGAEIGEGNILEVIEALAESESVMDALLTRGGLPVVCVEKIFLTVSSQVKQQLISRHNLSRHLLEGKMEYAREWATLGLTRNSDDANVEALVSQMHRQHRLTSSVIIRALCVGDFRFFEHAFSRMTQVPVENVRKLMMDAGERGFRALYKLTPLPPSYYDAVNKLLDIALGETQNGKQIPEDFCQRVLDKIKAGGYDLSIENMPLLIAIIKGNVSDFTAIQ